MNNILTDSQSGFTLIEVLIAMVIFSIGILGVSAMQITAIQGNSTANNISQASNYASDRIETFLTLAYDDPLLSGGVSLSLDDLVTPSGQDVSADGNYDIYWNVAIDNPVPDSKTVKVIVRQKGRTKTVSLEIIKENR